MARLILFRLIALGVVVVSTSCGVAQEDLINELYGRGLHEFYSKNYEEAHKHFTASIEQGSRDPRCFYFRGLAYARLGRPDESTADIKRGAEIELANTELLVSVSQSLQRVQGNDRLAIEKERAAARLEASRKAKALRDAMYEQWKRDEAKVLRKPPVAGGAAPAEGAKAGAGKGDDLFNEPAAPKAAKPPEPGIKPDAKPAAKPDAKSDDPFGDEPADEKKPADAKKPDAKEPGDDDPFGDAPAEKKPAEKKADAPKAEDDPFGEEPAAPAAGKKPAEKPAPAKPDDDDPFK